MQQKYATTHVRTPFAIDDRTTASQSACTRADLVRLAVPTAIAVAGFGLALLSIIAYSGWSANEAAIDREQRLLDNALRARLIHAVTELADAARWITASPIGATTTGSGLNLRAPGRFNPALHVNAPLHVHDELYVLDASNRFLGAWLDGVRHDSSAYELRRQALGPVIQGVRHGSTKAPFPRLLGIWSTSPPRGGPRDGMNGSETGRGAPKGSGHLLVIDKRPALVAVIVTAAGARTEGSAPAIMLAVEYVDGAALSQIGRSLLLADLSLNDRPAGGVGIASRPLVGDDGVLAGHLSWTTQQPGHALLTVILPLAACGVLITGLLAWIVYGRLRRASAAIDQREREAHHLTTHDAVSGLPNRRHALEEIDKFLHSFAARRGRRQALAAHIDIDRFKDVNDTLGHEAGDELIKLLAERLSVRIRIQDFLARVGGDEFVILCIPATTDAVTALADRIGEALAEPFLVDGQPTYVTASVGFAFAPSDGNTADEVLRHAEIALYEAKRLGRNRAVVFGAEMADLAQRRRSLELDLRSALRNSEFTVSYQPTISCSTGQVVGLEALLRWSHSDRGDVSPSEFIPVMESAGLLPAVSEFVLDRAMSDSKRWPCLQVSVNLSPAHFHHAGLESMLHRLTAKHSVNPNRFTLEITEGVLLEAGDRVDAVLSTIRKLGFKTALDDFGTGYSSLSYLCNFQFDKIKIDQSFISRLSRIASTKTIVKSVVMLGDGLDMDIVAEGIETPYEAALMARLGCTELQGFYFSRPLPACEMARFLRSYVPWRPEPEVQNRPTAVSA